MSEGIGLSNLTPKEQKFIKHLIENENSTYTQASVAAYGESEHAKKHAWKIVRRPRIRKVLDQIEERVIEELALTRASQIRDYERIAADSFNFETEQGHTSSDSLKIQLKCLERIDKISGFETVKVESPDGSSFIPTEIHFHAVSSKEDN